MKVYRLLPLLTIAFLGGCYVMDVPDPEAPQSVVRLSLDDDPYALAEPIGIDYETSRTLAFSYEDISRIVAEAPLGWTVQVRMSSGNGTLKVSAPKYGTESVQSGDVVLKLYDGSGSFSEKKFPVYAIEGDLEFSIVDFDLSAVSEFTLGSRTTVRFNCSPSFKNIEFDLPDGWKAMERTRGTFTVIAPDLSVESGDAVGTVTVTPVSWTGLRSEELSRSFAVHVDATKPTFQFVDEETSFGYGETRELEITAKGLRDIVLPEAPEGWSIDWSGLLDGTVRVTAPEKTSESFKGEGALELSAVSNTDGSTVVSNSCVVRLYGINSAAELLAFRSVYEKDSRDEPDTDPESIGKWLVDGALSLNSDISLTNDMLVGRACIIKYLNVPLEGNGHTVDLDLECNATVAAIFQYAAADVRNLKLTGSISNSYSAGLSYIAPLVASPMKSTYDNVVSSVTVTYDVPESVLARTVVGGICAYPRANYASTYVNCVFDGTIHCKSDVFSAGGIVGCTDVGKPGSVTTVDHCTFSGEIICDHAYSDSGITPRIGGMLGDLARQGVITDCTSEGTIMINANGKRFSYNSGCGIGGLVGRITAPADGYSMSATIKNVRFTGTIRINNPAPDEDKTRYGQILGCSPSDKATAVLVKESWAEEGTLSL